jgi:hypothetical protein
MLSRAGISAAQSVVAACEAMTGDRCCARDGGLERAQRAPCSDIL